MSASFASRTAILATIKNEFEKYRDDGGHGHVPDRLKALALSAFDKDISRSEVALAAGLSTKTIGNWRAVAERLTPKRLNVISGERPASLCSAQSAPSVVLIRVRLASGVEIELPRTELDAHFLSLLNGLGGAR